MEGLDLLLELFKTAIVVDDVIGFGEPLLAWHLYSNYVLDFLRRCAVAGAGARALCLYGTVHDQYPVDLGRLSSLEQQWYA